MAVVQTGDPSLTIELDMRALPKEARKAARPKLRKAGENIVGVAKILSGWSTRIPGTIRVSTSFRVDREGVTVVAGGPNAPHARPYEGLSRNPFRHPVYGTDTWVSQPARPYLFPAGKANIGTTDALMHEALADAAASIGFK